MASLPPVGTQRVINDVVSTLSANSDVPYRATLAEAVAEFPVGYYFKTDDKAGVGPHPGELWIYQRSAGAPGYVAQVVATASTVEIAAAIATADGLLTETQAAAQNALNYGNAEIRSSFVAADAETWAVGAWVQITSNDTGTHASKTGDFGASGGQTPNSGVFQEVVSIGLVRRAALESTLAAQQTALATTQAGIATTAAASTATTLASSVKNGGKGEINDSSTGPSVKVVPSNKSRADTTAEENPDGTLGLVHEYLDTKRGFKGFRYTYALRHSAEQAVAKSIQTTSDRGHATSGAMVISIPVDVRYAAGFGPALWVDGKDKVLRAPWVIPAHRTLPDGTTIPEGALVHRGGEVGFNRVTRLKQFEKPDDAFVVMAQKTTMRPKNKRTHQQCPTMAKSDHYLYAAFSAANKTLGGDFHDAESPDSYVAICRRPLSGGKDDWEEVAQALPSAPTYRVSDPAMQTIRGRVHFFLPLGLKGTDTEHYSQGCHVSVLETPDAPAGGNLMFTTPTFDGAYGFHATGTFENGEFWFPSYIPMNGFANNSGYFDTTYPTKGKNFVPSGAHLSRFIDSGVQGAPFVERISRLPSEANAALETYTEPQVVRLSRSLGATYDWWLTTRSTTGPREAWGTDRPDGGVDWTALGPCTKFNGNGASVRRRVIRLADGGIAYIGNLDPGTNRRMMGVAISDDEAQTFPIQLVVESASSAPPNWLVSYPDAVSWVDRATGDCMLAITYDEGRGVGPGLPANIWAHVFRVKDIRSGAMTTEISMLNRELVSSIADYEA